MKMQYLIIFLIIGIFVGEGQAMSPRQGGATGGAAATQDISKCDLNPSQQTKVKVKGKDGKEHFICTGQAVCGRYTTPVSCKVSEKDLCPIAKQCISFDPTFNPNEKYFYPDDEFSFDKIDKFNFESFNIIRINFSAPLEMTCYAGTLMYKCTRIGSTVVISDTQGVESSMAFPNYVDGSFSQTVKESFGKKSDIYYQELKKQVGILFEVPQIPSQGSFSPKMKTALGEIINAINDYDKNFDITKYPNYVINRESLKDLFEFSIASAQSGNSQKEKEDLIEKNGKIAQAILAIFRSGSFDIATSLTPFIGDARDFYELTTGLDLITGKKLVSFERFLCGMGIIGGSGAFFRNTLSKLRDKYFKKVLEQGLNGLPDLTPLAEGGWKSKAGLIYLPTGKKGEDRLKHILKHTVSKPGDPAHTVFKLSKQSDIIKLLDEAWKSENKIFSTKRNAWLVDMKGKNIGIKGESHILIATIGEDKIVTAYPISEKLFNEWKKQ
jgi:Pre-toxin TG